MNKIKEIKGPELNSKEQDDYDEDLQNELFRKAVEEFSNNKPVSTSSEDLAINPEVDLLPAMMEKICCWNCLKMTSANESKEHFYEDRIMQYKVVNFI